MLERRTMHCDADRRATRRHRTDLAGAVLQGLRTEFLNQQSISLSTDCVAILDRSNEQVGPVPVPCRASAMPGECHAGPVPCRPWQLCTCLHCDQTTYSSAICRSCGCSTRSRGNRWASRSSTAWKCTRYLSTTSARSPTGSCLSSTATATSTSSPSGCTLRARPCRRTSSVRLLTFGCGLVYRRRLSAHRRRCAACGSVAQQQWCGWPASLA